MLKNGILNKQNIITLCVVLCLFAFVGLVNTKSVSAAAPYLASDVLGQTDFTGNSSGTSSTAFDNPDGTAIDTVNHRLFVGDASNARILIFDLNENNNLDDKEADYVLGCMDFECNDRPGNAGALSSGYYGEVEYDSKHQRLFVSDYDNNRILVFDLSNGITNGMNASWVLGQPDFETFDSNITQNGLYGPYGGNTFDPTTDYLYVSDYSNYRILVFDLSNGITNGMNASWVLGQPDFETDNYETTQNGMTEPYGTAVDTDRQWLFVSDYGNDRVLVFDLSNGITNGMNASWVLGQPDFETSSYNIYDARYVYNPGDLVYDHTRKILFLGQYYYGVKTYNLSEGIETNMNASMIIGQIDFDYNNWANGTSQSEVYLGYPATIAVDEGSGRLWIPDAYNNRVLSFDFVSITLPDGAQPAIIPAATFGQPYSYQLPISGGQGDVTCELIEGSLPQNVTLSPDCVISGTPASNTVYQFVVRVTDSNGTAGSIHDFQSISLTVNHANALSTGGSAGGLANTGINSKNLQKIAFLLVVASTIGLVSFLKRAYRSKS